MKLIFSLIVSYLIGSIPTAYIMGKLYKGIDIRQHGSGNVGATNTFRVLGKNPGIIVLVLDILKGVLATTVVAESFGIRHVLVVSALGLLAVIGHNWTVFLNFKGGKGIATSLGVLVGLTINIAVIRPVVLGTVLIWLACFLISGYVSLSSIIASVCLPLLMIRTHQIELVLLGIVFCLFVVLRHQPNIKRLLRGEESRFNLPFRSKKSSFYS